jgi:hypothetical protein
MAIHVAIFSNAFLSRNGAMSKYICASRMQMSAIKLTINWRWESGRESAYILMFILLVFIEQSLIILVVGSHLENVGVDNK